MEYNYNNLKNGLKMFIDTVWVADIDDDKVSVLIDSYEPELAGKTLRYSELMDRYGKYDIKSYDFSRLEDKFSPDEMRKLCRTQGGVRRYELCVRSDSGINWFETVLTPVYEDDGHCRVAVMSRIINSIRQNDIILSAIEESYDYIMYVDMIKNSYIAYFFNTENGEPLPPVVSFDFDSAMSAYNEKYVADYDRDKAETNFSRDNILRELRTRETYSFFVDIIEDGERHTKIINAHFYDRNNKIVILTRSDITGMRDERQQALSIALSNTSIHEFGYYISESRCEISDRTIDRYGFNKIYSNMPYSFMNDVVFEDDWKDFEEMYRRINSGDCSTANCVFRDKSGELWLRQTLTVIPSRSGRRNFAIGIIEDISSQKKMEFRAERDQFTGLYNKTSALTIIQMILNRAPQETNYMFMLDLDNFKEVNDRYGHFAGDDVLVKIAVMLRSMFRSNDVTARFGGDEFIVFMPKVNDIKIVESKAETIINTIKNEIGLEYPDACLTTSIGIARTDDRISVGKLFRLADTALYRAKQSGKDRYCIAEPDDESL